MKYIKHDFEMSSIRRIIGKAFLKLYTYNVRLPVSQGISNWYHDVFSKVYDQITPLALPKYYQIIDMIIQENVSQDSTVLDLCCGTGNIAIAAAKKAKEVIALDASRGMLSKARNKAGREGIQTVKFVYADVKQRLDFDDESFNVVTAGWSVPTNVPLFQDNNRDIIGETHRVLKKDGRLILFEGLHEVTDMYLSKEEYDDLLSGAGYNDIEIRNINNLYAVVSAKK